MVEAQDRIRREGLEVKQLFKKTNTGLIKNVMIQKYIQKNIIIPTPSFKILDTPLTKHVYVFFNYNY